MSKPKRVIKKLKPKEEDPRSLPYCHEVLSVFCNEEVAIQFFFDKSSLCAPEKRPKYDEGSAKRRQGRKKNNALRKMAEKKCLLAKGHA